MTNPTRSSLFGLSIIIEAFEVQLGLGSGLGLGLGLSIIIEALEVHLS